MENSRFEESFRDAFGGAEVSPSEAVWTNIELSLEKESGGKMKRNLLLFQLLAAASVAFACGVGALYYVNSPGIPKEQPQLQSRTEERSSPHRDATAQSVPENQADKIQNKTVVPGRAKSRVNATRDQLVSDNTAREVKQASDKPFATYAIAKRPLSAYAITAHAKLVLPKAEEPVQPDPGMLLLARLKDEEKKYRDEDKKDNAREKLWASVGFGAGSYRPNREIMWNDQSSASKTGTSYSAGIHVTGRLAKRLVLQGGVSYLTQSADFTSASSDRGAASLSEYVRPDMFESGSDSGFPTPSYKVTSSLQFVSVPVQAGYVIVDQAFSIQVNGGVATDLFISNTLTPEDSQVEKVTQAAGKDSPYRTVTFSGLFGTEFSYRIADHYRISLNPGLRYSFGSIYKEEIAARITPVTYDVSLRFRYIFK